LDDGYGIDVIYLDYKKTFDTVSQWEVERKVKILWNYKENVRVDYRVLAE